MITRELLKRTLLVVLGTLVGLFCAELIIRLCFPSHAPLLALHRYGEEERGKFARYDRLLGWDGKEYAEGDFVWVDCSHHVRQNKYGYRGPEQDIRKKSARRFVVLGDSFVWGFCVPDDAIFTSVMDQRSAGRTEMINMGVSGFGTDQEYLLWQSKGRRRAPDEVLLMVDVYTDLWDNISNRRYDYPKPQFVPDAKGALVLTNVPVPHRDAAWASPERENEVGSGNWLNMVVEHSAFANLLLDAGIRNDSVRRYLESRDLVPERRAGYDWEYPFYYVGPDPEMQYAWNTLFALIRKLGSDVRKAGARLTVVIVPSIIQVYPELWERFTLQVGPEIAANLDPAVPNRLLASWCEQNGIRVIDLLPGLQNAGRTNPYLYFPVNLHWTADGHRVVSDILLRAFDVK